MSDIDDRESEQCPVLQINKEVSTMNKRIYRVSWIVDGKRQESFFEFRFQAEKFINILMDCAEVVKTNVNPLIGEIEVQND